MQTNSAHARVRGHTHKKKKDTPKNMQQLHLWRTSMDGSALVFASEFDEEEVEEVVDVVESLIEAISVRA
jgi:hypothetical protein